MAKTEFTLGSLRAYERNDDMADWVIRDANNHLVAGGIPKELAVLFVKAPEMYELLLFGQVAIMEGGHNLSPLMHKWLDEARRIKAAIDGEG